ncbi:hypothetical protein [Catellatospora sp. TT07R-123]|uniref:hypothetical protein n=1 Tax=Catellatospora sp. TT07R-123 TaxID=2733863 RepID=UPI001BB3C820|nr:hypothetical protein [Catellatospora sp. TT07R-123]
MTEFWGAIGAIGSFFGMILAGIAGYVAFRLFRVESGRDLKADEFRREQAEELVRHQATRIGFWVDSDAKQVVVLNSSELPIFRIRIVFQDYRSYDQVLPPVIFPDEKVVHFQDALVPGERIHVSEQAFREEALNKNGFYFGQGTYIQFIDNAGFRWKRAIEGGLSEPEKVR